MRKRYCGRGEHLVNALEDMLEEALEEQYRLRLIIQSQPHTLNLKYETALQRIGASQYDESDMRQFNSIARKALGWLP